MPYCSKCKKIQDKMQSEKTCKRCAEIGKNYYHTHREQQAAANKVWRAKKSSKEKLRENCRKWRQKNRQKYLECAKNYFLKNSEKPSYRLNKAKQQAKRRNLEFSITLEKYTELISQACYYCNGSFGKVTKGTGLDRIDSAKGYVDGNVLPCCKICNRLKGDNFTVEETLIAVKTIISFRSQ